jgi:two-component system cell cycle response regulator
MEGRQVDPRDVTSRILVVDDSRVVRCAVSGALRASGYYVEEAADGGAALEMIASGSYDVIITDLAMPVADGFEVLAAAKRLAPLVEVIILTGEQATDVASAIRALRLGAHDYLAKPPAYGEEVVQTVSRALEKKRLREDNQRLMRQLEMLSLTDQLTGLPNRRAFDDALAREVARSRRHDHPLGVVMFDLDHFKTVNDTYGHAVGDLVLQRFADLAAASLRREDGLYRHGGEEFVALLPHADSASAIRSAERIVTSVAAAPLLTHPAPVSITVSAGVAALSPNEDPADLVQSADRALYEAKNEGRNRVRSRAGVA